jgi:cytochrome b561
MGDMNPPQAAAVSQSIKTSAAKALLNTQDGYGALTKLFHWAIVALFAFQFAAGNIMVRIGPHETALGLTQDAFYNWHKSIGLVALAVAVFRLLARRSGQLPDWAPTLSAPERKFVHRAEQVLYTAMFVMPISGYLYVMAGGYGVNLFGVVDLGNRWLSLRSGRTSSVATLFCWRLPATLAWFSGTS